MNEGVNADGFRMKVLRDITKNDIAEICLELDETLNSLFEPEGINEGGIVWSDHRGNGKTYKSIRFRHIKKWPWICGEEKNAWIGDETVLEIDTPKLSTYVKSKDTTWTLDELTIFADCFDRHGFKVYRSTFPSKKELKFAPLN
jgi:hypothetical protein